MSSSSFASRLALSASMPRSGIGLDRTVKVGFLAPLSGDVEAWGRPGYNGCLIWADWINTGGGILINGQRHIVEIIPFDCQYDGELAKAGARKLVLENDVKLLMMLGGDTFLPIQDFVNQRKILTSTLLPSDLSPDTPYLIAPGEAHPIFNVTGVGWLADNRPELKTAAMCAQRDALGLPSVATYRAAFEAAGIALQREVFFPANSPDIRAVVTNMLAGKPDILCWDTAYEPFVHALTEEAFRQGFAGQIISCTADNYPAMVARTSKEFMEGFIFQFPDFDDPKLNDPGVNFNRANEFYEEYNKRFPGTWSAVSWEYASILSLWRSAIEMAGSVEPVSVLAAMKAGGRGAHAFGDAEWWGTELFGIDNALVGDWPVVAIRSGKARIEEFRSTIEWCKTHGELLERHMRALGQMWDQRVAPTTAGYDDIDPRQFSMDGLQVG
jgi:branched-chain amino acid transport system substrate-binding protein